MQGLRSIVQTRHPLLQPHLQLWIATGTFVRIGLPVTLLCKKQNLLLSVLGYHCQDLIKVHHAPCAEAHIIAKGFCNACTASRICYMQYMQYCIVYCAILCSRLQRPLEVQKQVVSLCLVYVGNTYILYIFSQIPQSWL